jgi:hypothetical protein
MATVSRCFIQAINRTLAYATTNAHGGTGSLPPLFVTVTMGQGTPVPNETLPPLFATVTTGTGVAGQRHDRVQLEQVCRHPEQAVG